MGIEEYKYLATLDDRTCETCQALDGRVFKVSAAREGVNYPTMHPRCRCTTTINKAYLNRRARDPLTGKSELVDGGLTYEEWKKGLSPEQRTALDSAMRKNTRTSADKLKAAVDKSGGSGIIKAKNVETAVNGVNLVGKIDREIYKCVTEDIVTDEVIITDEQIFHIRERHPSDYEKFGEYIPQILAEPDYILEANKPNTAFVLKRIKTDEKNFQLILRLKTSHDREDYKNSIITFLKIKDKEWNRCIRNKKILYKRE